MMNVDGSCIAKSRRFHAQSHKTNMLVPNHVRDCVIFVGREVNPTNDGTPDFSLCGTAFLVARPVTGTNGEEFATYLVTAKHVIDGIKKDGGYRVWLRMNLSGGKFDWIHTSLSDWLYHPGGALVDAAVLPFDIDLPEFDLEKHDHRACPLHLSLDPEKIERERIGIGDELLFVGLFTQHYGSERNIPIVRVGNIAALPGEAVNTRLGPMDAYLAEARSIGGLSGSPVFVNLGTARVIDRKLLLAETENPKILLLGLMHGHWDSPDSTIGISATDSSSSGETVNMGIAIVVPIKRILEILDHDVIKAFEKQKGDAWRERNLPTMD
jgi:hypothetical protein